MRIFKEFTFEAAHRLPKVPIDHKCYRLHGHSWKTRLWLEGTIDEMGWIRDFADIYGVFLPLMDRLDHNYLNDIIENPTSENVAIWIFNEVKPSIPQLCQVDVQETCTCGVEYTGD